MRHSTTLLAAFASALFAAGALAAGPDAQRERAVTDPAAAAEAEGAEVKSPLCVRETGTRLPRKTACRPGRVYDRDDIRRTGAVDVGDALQKLDPAVTIRRY